MLGCNTGSGVNKMIVLLSGHMVDEIFQVARSAPRKAGGKMICQREIQIQRTYCQSDKDSIKQVPADKESPVLE